MPPPPHLPKAAELVKCLAVGSPPGGPEERQGQLSCLQSKIQGLCWTSPVHPASSLDVLPVVSFPRNVKLPAAPSAAHALMSQTLAAVWPLLGMLSLLTHTHPPDDPHIHTESWLT